MRRPDRYKVCRCCGFPVADDELALLFRAGKSRRIFQIVAAAGQAGISRESLTDRIYSDHPDGGPLCAREVVTTMIFRYINPKLEPHGLKIVSGSGRGPYPYRLIELRAS